MKDNSYIKGEIEALLVAIDSEDWDSLSKLLHDDTLYEVTGFPRFQGRRAVLDYYENIRPIRVGVHTIESIVIEGDSGICCGHFAGTKKDGEKIDVLFADAMTFENFKIKSRRVYFCAPESGD